MNVCEQQCFLGGLGYYTLKRADGTLAIDGIPGQATRSAIYNFQVQHTKRPDGSVLVADGVWGPATEKAIREVIGNGEPPQKIHDPVKPVRPTGDYPWLDLREIRCQCNGRYCKGLPDHEFSKQTLAWANQIGEHFQTKIRVTSGYRCERRNAETPGASPNSKHKLAIAIDLQSRDGNISPKALYDYADALVGDHGGVGIYRWGIHIDSRGFRSRWDSR